MHTMDCYTLPLDGTTEKLLSLYLYTNVCNTKEIRESLMSGKLSCCVIKASLVVDPFQVAIAANKAALREKRSKLTTKSIFTEILYAMSTSSKITDSLVKFGIHDNDKNIVVVMIHRPNEKEKLEEEVLKRINGDRIPISRLNEFTDEPKVKKLYNVEQDELAVSSLLDSVISRISCDFASTSK
ncbi:EKC/KEOPS complex subunit TPRKB-like [Venturia canescens]|uniref:EKC/KEOPS complex subunit TPRKB-like n=1 Tax=Venturia canescens TaxID=32260 RepID=UPI001C9D4596|nr:EKC/KEOPS complex subunit TPRKB-like [Venturia canescens]